MRANKEPYFYWRKEWAEYAKSINDPKTELAFFDAITKYGCYKIEPTGISGENLSFFNSRIRTEIDKQHKKQGRKIWKKAN